MAVAVMEPRSSTIGGLNVGGVVAAYGGLVVIVTQWWQTTGSSAGGKPPALATGGPGSPHTLVCSSGVL